MKDKAILELTKQEAEALFFIFDTSVKSAGISGPISRNVNHFIDKINVAFSDDVKKTEVKEEPKPEKEVRSLEGLIVE